MESNINVNGSRDSNGMRDSSRSVGSNVHPHQEKIHLLENGLKVLKMAF